MLTARRCAAAARADKGTQKKQDIKITGASTLAGDEVDRMVKDAERFAEEDKKKREAVDVKNQARGLHARAQTCLPRPRGRYVLHSRKLAAVAAGPFVLFARCCVLPASASNAACPAAAPSQQDHVSSLATLSSVCR